MTSLGILRLGRSPLGKLLPGRSLVAWSGIAAISALALIASGQDANAGLTRAQIQKSSSITNRRTLVLPVRNPFRVRRVSVERPAGRLASIPLPLRNPSKQSRVAANTVAVPRAIDRFRKRLKARVTAADVAAIRAAAKAGRQNSQNPKYSKYSKAGLLKLLRNVKPKGLPIKLAAAVITVESSWRPAARGSSGEYGLMQLMPGTARLYAPKFVKRLKDDHFAQVMMHPKMNMRVGTRVLHWCFRRAKGNVAATIGCYNRGPGKMWQWSENSITKRYVGKIRKLLKRAS